MKAKDSRINKIGKKRNTRCESHCQYIITFARDEEEYRISSIKGFQSYMNEFGQANRS